MPKAVNAWLSDWHVDCLFLVRKKSPMALLPLFDWHTVSTGFTPDTAADFEKYDTMTPGNLNDPPSRSHTVKLGTRYYIYQQTRA